MFHSKWKVVLERIGIPQNNMPELPEVETVRSVLESTVLNKKIQNVEVLRLNTIDGDASTFIETLKDKTIKNITRYGKFLFFHFDGDIVVISHLRMEGKYYLYNKDENNSKYARVIFHFSDNTKLIYDDSRCFGKMKLSNENNYLKEKEIEKLGLEPFDIDNINYLKEKTAGIKGPIKCTLLDQSIMTGLGNIYADEVLFMSKVNPFTPTHLINDDEWKALLDNSKKILNKAIELGGSTIKSYHPGKGIDGEFQMHLKAYGKKNTPCVCCGTTMKFSICGGRGTTFCSNCQPLKKEQINVALFGKIAVGKSLFMSHIKNKGYKVISTDEIVHTLYRDKEIINHINLLFDMPQSDALDIVQLRNIVANDNKARIKLEKYIHPLVKKELIKELRKDKHSLRFVEIPLLYQAKMEKMFDYIVALSMDEDKRIKLLKKRNKDVESYLALDRQYNFDKNKKKADFIIENNGSIKQLNKNIDLLIDKLLNHLN